MSRAKVVGIGAGGHVRAVLDALRASDDYTVVGLTDIQPNCWGSTVDGVPILGGDEVLPELMCNGVTRAFVGVGSVGDASVRRHIAEHLEDLGLEIITISHPTAIVSDAATIGPGTVILAGAIVTAGAIIGKNVIVAIGSIVAHDCTIGDYVHIGPGAILAGNVTIGAESHIGLGASILQNLHIGRGAVIGAGTVVLRDVPEGATVVGVPGRIIKQRHSIIEE